MYVRLLGKQALILCEVEVYVSRKFYMVIYFSQLVCAHTVAYCNRFLSEKHLTRVCLLKSVKLRFENEQVSFLPILKVFAAQGGLCKLAN